MLRKARTLRRFPQKLDEPKEWADMDNNQLKALYALRKLARIWPKSLGLVFHADGGGWLKVVDIRGADDKKTFEEDPSTARAVARVQLPLTGCV